HDDVGSVDAALRSKRGEQNGVRPRQYLWPSVRHLLSAQRRNWLRLAAGAWHAQQWRPRLRVWIEHDGIVVAPRGAAWIEVDDVADVHGGAARDRYLLQLAVRNAEKPDPLAIR